jgi:hypothetical protein
MRLTSCRQLTFVAALLASGAACNQTVSTNGDETSWMLGWFSLESPDADLSVDFNINYHIRDDGTVLAEIYDGCDDRSEGTRLWEAEDEDTLRISPGFSEGDAWLIRRLSACSFEQVRVLTSGMQGIPTPIFTGRLCTTRGEDQPDCVGSGCNVCYKRWCDGEEPVPCNEDAL